MGGPKGPLFVFKPANTAVSPLFVPVIVGHNLKLSSVWGLLCGKLLSLWGLCWGMSQLKVAVVCHNLKHCHRGNKLNFKVGNRGCIY